MMGFFTKKTSHSFLTSLRKELSYIEAVITEPVEVRCDNRSLPGGIIRLEPISNFKISRLLYERYYSCLDYPGCSCCSGFWNFTQAALATQGVHYDQEMTFTFNGLPVHYVVNIFEGATCPFNKEGCVVHFKNPITCMFPLIQFRRNKRTNSVLLTKTHFGRNWLLGCPVQFSSYAGLDHFLIDVMWKFEYFKEYMDNIGVSHRVGEVISQIEEGAKTFFGQGD